MMMIVIIITDLFQEIIYSSYSYTNPFFFFDTGGFGVVVSPPNRRSKAVAPDDIAIWRFHMIRLV